MPFSELYFLFPLVVTHGVTGVGDETGAGEHVSHGEFGNGFGRSLGGVLHVNAGGLGIVNVDVVNADTTADDELELAALGFIDLSGANLSLGANDDDVEIAQGLAEFGGLIELLNDFVTQLDQLGHGGLIHTVSNKNTHSKFSV